MSEEMLDYGEMKNNLLVYKSKEQIADICIAHYKEIERLNKKYENAVADYEEQKYIINELEKYINNTKLEEFEKVYGRRYDKTFTQAEVIICNMILTRLKELKGSDK